jgi:hypothetical protein
MTDLNLDAHNHSVTRIFPRPRSSYRPWRSEYSTPARVSSDCSRR